MKQELRMIASENYMCMQICQKLEDNALYRGKLDRKKKPIGCEIADCVRRTRNHDQAQIHLRSRIEIHEETYCWRMLANKE